MAIFIDQNRKVKNIFVNMDGKKKSISSVWVNKNDVKTKVFQIKNNEKNNDIYWESSENEHINWDYTLDDKNNIITLNYYKGISTDVIVYANYIINGKIYTTQIANNIGSKETTLYMFNGYAKKECKNIKTIVFSKSIDTRNLTNISWMFHDCELLEYIDIKNFNTSNVTNMSYMFNCCFLLKNLEIKNFDTSNVTNMIGLFGSCKSLSNLDVSNFDTSNVTSMSGMFSSCESISNLDVTNFDTSNVTSMSNMFLSCRKITSLDLRNFNTNNVTNMNGMFGICILLKNIYVTRNKWSTAKATTTDMFVHCATSSVIYK